MTIVSRIALATRTNSADIDEHGNPTAPNQSCSQKLQGVARTRERHRYKVSVVCGSVFGKVSEVDLFGGKNKLKAINVSTSSGSRMLGKEIIIENELIDRIGHGVFLNVSKSELKNQLD